MTLRGVYVGNSLSELEAFDAWLGERSDAVVAFVGRNNWADFTGSTSWATKFWANTDKSVLWSVPLIVNGASLDAAARGDYDAYYRDVARTLAASQPNGDIIVRTGWEFNGQWFPWFAGGKEGSYIGAYRSFVEAFRTVSDRFRFEWCPNAGDQGMDIEKAYPGDAYVDIVSLDVYYNTAWDPKDPEAAWKVAVEEKFGLRWLQDFAAAHGKRIAISEWGVMSDDSGAFVRHMAEWMAANDVVYEAYWNSNADFAGKLNVPGKETVGAVYRDAFAGGFDTVITGTARDDLLVGTDRSERLSGGSGADTMSGGKGDDTYDVDVYGDRVIETVGEGTDEIRSWLSVQMLPDHVENLTLMAGAGQTAIGNALANRIIGGVGNDTLDGGDGNDTLMGGLGIDTFVIRPGTGRDTILDFHTGDVVVIDSSRLRSFTDVRAALEAFNGDTILSLPTGDVVVFRNTRIGDLAASDFAFTGTPPAPPPVWRPDPPAVAATPATLSFTGNGSANTMTGTDGNDYINGAGGDDILIGQRGHDTYVVDQPGDRILELPGEGIDRVESWSRSYVLPENVEHITAVSSYGQSLTGNALGNRIEGARGDDVLDGAGGDDWLKGGGGKDVLVMRKGGGHDTIVDFAAGAGTGSAVRLDAAFGLSSFAAIKAAMSQVDRDVLLTLPGGDTILFLDHRIADFAADDFGVPEGTPAPQPPSPPATSEPPASPGPIQYYRVGGGGADTLSGNDLNDYIDGSGGIDVMAGGRGHDTYVVDQWGDRVIEREGEGIDTVRSWAKDYTLPEHVENLGLIAAYSQNGTGNARDNRVEGGAGDNRINGGAGNDWLKGGGGNDTFVMKQGGGHDTIADFTNGPGRTDVCLLDGYGFSSFAQVAAALSQHGADTLLSLPGGDTVLFRNTLASGFVTDDFAFAGAVAPSSSTTSVVVRAAAESWEGNPVFRLLIDGRQVGADTAVAIQNGAGRQEFTFVAPVSAPKSVAVQFVNDGWGGSPDRDRNLIVDRISVNGRILEAETATYDRGWGSPLTGVERMTHSGLLRFDTSQMT